MSVRIILQTIAFLFSITISIAQNLEKQERIANNQMREGNTLFQKSNYAEAEVAYKKSVATYPNNQKTIFNLGNSMMQQKRYKEAITQYVFLAKNAKNNSLRAQSFHNIGNANMGLNDFQKAVDAYKNSLRINPKDEETRYNLALAQELLKQQQEQNKDNKDDQNKDNKDQDKENQDKNKDEENKDEKKDKEDDKNKKEDSDDDEKENKDGDQDQEDKPNEDKQDPKDNKGDEEQKQQQPQPGKLSPQQMKQLLEAMQNEENKTQNKMNAKRAKGKPVKTEKDW